MALNLALCNSFQINGEDKWCFCFPRKKKRKRSQGRDVSRGQFIHDAGFLLQFPYPSDLEPMSTLIQAENIGMNVADITIFDPKRTYLFSQGPNMAVFGGDHTVLVDAGTTVDEIAENNSENGLPVLSPAVKDFLETTITQTLNGGYVNVITFWNNKAWHVHSHPILNAGQKTVIACVIVTEPFNRAIRMNFNPVT